MLAAPLPDDEAARLDALRRYCVLDTPASPAFDRLARVAAHVLQVPTVLVSLVDGQRQWFKARVGLQATETPRDISFCGHAVFQRQPLVVCDASADPRFADNPLVAGPLQLRFYCGLPLITAEGHALGTLCAIDYRPREAPTPAQMQVMAELADAVLAALELHRFALQQQGAARLSRLLGELAALAHAAAGVRDALPALLETLCRHTGTVFAQALLRCADGSNCLEPVACHAMGPAAQAAARAMAQAADLGSSADLPAQAVACGGPLLLPDLAALDAPRARVAAAQGWRSGALFAFQAGGQWQGLVEIYGPFLSAGAEEVQTLAAFVCAQLSRLAERELLERMKDDFVAVVSHELRTPMTSIAGTLELLDEGKGGELPPRAANMVRVAHRNSLRLNRLVDSMLDIGKMEAGHLQLHKEVQPLARLVRQALSETHGLAQSLGVECRFDAQGPQLHAAVDTDRFIQVLTNLLSNALKFSPPGGQVQVRLRSEGTACRISVADQGPGIADAFVPNLFRKFAQDPGMRQARQAGTGLGLAIVKHLVESMGGQVGVGRAEGGGAVFHVDLPAAPPPAQPARCSGAAAAPSPTAALPVPLAQ